MPAASRPSRLPSGPGGCLLRPTAASPSSPCWALGFIIVTGGAVRLTGSGLGCPDWPTCADHQVVAPWQYHAVVEFGNRSSRASSASAVIRPCSDRGSGSPRRRDLTVLSWGLVIGVLGQIVLGGEAVKHQLAPQFVMAHFLVSIVLLSDAVVLHDRAAQPDGEEVGVAPGRRSARGRSSPRSRSSCPGCCSWRPAWSSCSAPSSPPPVRTAVTRRPSGWRSRCTTWPACTGSAVWLFVA